MMYMTPDYRRRIHIMGKPDNTVGHMLKVYDAETSEPILNITRIVITIDARKMNEAEIIYDVPVTQAEVTFVEYDANGKLIVEHGDVVSHTVILDNPSFALTVYEVEQPEDTEEGDTNARATTTTDLPTNQRQYSP